MKGQKGYVALGAKNDIPIIFIAEVAWTVKVVSAYKSRTAEK